MKLKTRSMRLRVWLLLGLMLGAVPAQAEILVLVQGYLGKGNQWYSSGVTEELQKAGWVDGGRLFTRNRQVAATGGQAGPMRFYTVDIPTEAPFSIQQQFLAAYLAWLRVQFPTESVAIAAHSAGGVLARLFMVKHPDYPVRALITFASPHLGTELAEVGSALGRTPLSWFTPFVGGQSFNRSQVLYQELARERPQSFLFWLNRQPYPEQTRYVAVIRKDSGLLGGDSVVADWSQDMNNVAALRGRAERIFTEGGHSLQRNDGVLLVRLLARQRYS